MSSGADGGVSVLSTISRIVLSSCRDSKSCADIIFGAEMN